MKKLRRMDYILLIAVLLMSVIGLVMIFSASSASTVLRYEVASTHYFIKQAVILCLALVAGIIVFFVPKKWYKAVGILGILGVTFFLFLVLASGEIHGNAASWFSLFGSKVQPSEFAKPLLIIFMAEYYGSLEKYNNRLVKNRNSLWLSYFFPLIVGGILFLLIFKQPDMGSAVILLGICGLTYLCIPFVNKKRDMLFWPVIGLALVCVAFFAVGKDYILSEEQLSRFNFQSPCSRYQDDTGYQVCNALIAVSNGGAFGTGLGNSTQKYLYLPESHTDMIFPIICEEIGAVGGLIIIFLYGFILIRIYNIASAAEGTRDKVLAYGSLWFFTLHIIINLFGVLSLMPLTGVPLPFLSYGGSFLLNAIILIFIVERVNVDTKQKKFRRELKELSGN